MPVSIVGRSLVLALALGGAGAQTGVHQADAARYRVDVDLVAQTFSVTDAKGHPVHGLKDTDIRITEDGIPQKIVAFAEGSRVAGEGAPGLPAGTSIFILFDTSDAMYSSFPYVCDAIADFLRKLDPADAAALYTFSRNLSRAAPLTRDHALLRAALAQNISAGDETALFNCLLLTLRDAAKAPGRKAVVVFSNGPDNKSMLSPDDVGQVAVDEGIPVYIVSTLDPGRNRGMAAALARLTQKTGGKLYLTGNWQAQAQAFIAIHEDLGASYTAYYYPAANPNREFRHIKVEVVSSGDRRYAIRAREGYHPRNTVGQPNRVADSLRSSPAHRP
jgi:Ca-activated chloride channel homolog